MGSLHNDDDILEKIKKLSELKDSGIITEEEFETKKTELLSKI
ncbi:MAG: SHOCT domain-containing protein [Clostridia bacterium]|nr:SHOCT domain-containing protein [Clostridia bacterium]